MNTGLPKEIDGIKYQWCGKAELKKFLEENPLYYEELKSKITGSFTTSMTKEEVDAIYNISESERIGLEDLDILESKSKKNSRKKPA